MSEELKDIVIRVETSESVKEVDALSSSLGNNASAMGKLSASEMALIQHIADAKNQMESKKLIAQALGVSVSDVTRGMNKMAEEMKAAARAADDLAAFERKLAADQKKLESSLVSDAMKENKAAFIGAKKEMKDYAEIAENAIGVNTGLAGVIRGAGNPAFLAAGIAALAVGAALEVWKEKQEEIKKSVEESTRWVEAYTKSLTENKSAQESFSDFQLKVIASGRALAEIKLEEAITKQGDAIKKTAEEAEKAELVYKFSIHTGGALSMSAEENARALTKAAAEMKRTAAEAESAKLYLQELTEAHRNGFKTVGEYEASLKHWNDTAIKAYDITNKISPATRTLWQEQARLADEFNRGAMSLDEFVKRAAQLQTIYSASIETKKTAAVKIGAAARQKIEVDLFKENYKRAGDDAREFERQLATKERAALASRNREKQEATRRNAEQIQADRVRFNQFQKIENDMQMLTAKGRMKSLTDERALQRGILQAYGATQAQIRKFDKQSSNLRKQLAAQERNMRMGMASEVANQAAAAFENNKGMAKAATVINTAQAAMAGFSTQPFFPLGILMGAFAIAMGIQNLQKIESTSAPAGQAHSGMNVPRDGSYNLQAGEVVVPNTDALMDISSSISNLAKGDRSGGSKTYVTNYNGTVIDAQDADRKIAHANQRGQRTFGIRGGR